MTNLANSMTDEREWPRLSLATMSRCKTGIQRPGYDRAGLRPRCVHLGIGAFFRAHGAIYTDDVITSCGGDWGIVGVSLQRPEQRDRLAPQDGLYTTIQRSTEGSCARIIGSVLDVLVAPEDPAAVVTRLADPETDIVSLTVTEKGYCHDPSTGRLNETHADIRHDVANRTSPHSAIGALVAALAARRRAGLAPFTVLPCDNLAHNGALVRRLVMDFAALSGDDRLAQWIESHGAFPCTMVDRIVPAATDADRADACRLTGLADEAAIAHEPFRQWVIEDVFVDGIRPAWEDVGAELVGDVAPFETMKLRLLNASHSALAYLGYLAGHQTIDACVADPVLRAYVEALWRDEIIPVTTPPPGGDLAGYARALLQRFDNSAIRHRTWQIAMDGSQKLPQRLLATVRERRRRGLPSTRLATAIAAWMIYVGGVDLAGQAIDVRDPLLPDIREALARCNSMAPQDRVTALLALDGIFGRDLADDREFAGAVSAAYETLVRGGVRAALSAFQ